MVPPWFVSPSQGWPYGVQTHPERCYGRTRRSLAGKPPFGAQLQDHLPGSPLYPFPPSGTLCAMALPVLFSSSSLDVHLLESSLREKILNVKMEFPKENKNQSDLLKIPINTVGKCILCPPFSVLFPREDPFPRPQKALFPQQLSRSRTWGEAAAKQIPVVLSGPFFRFGFLRKKGQVNFSNSLAKSVV